MPQIISIFIKKLKKKEIANSVELFSLLIIRKDEMCPNVIRTFHFLFINRELAILSLYTHACPSLIIANILKASLAMFSSTKLIQCAVLQTGTTL